MNSIYQQEDREGDIMNNKEFQTHFINVCEQLKIDDYLHQTYEIIPISEDGKKYNSIDDMMRLWFLQKKRICDFEQMVKLFTWKEGFYPLWIKVSVIEERIILQTSLRMRKAGTNDDRLFYPFIFD